MLRLLFFDHLHDLLGSSFRTSSKQQLDFLTKNAANVDVERKFKKENDEILRERFRSDLAMKGRTDAEDDEILRAFLCLPWLYQGLLEERFYTISRRPWSFHTSRKQEPASKINCVVIFKHIQEDYNFLQRKPTFVFLIDFYKAII